MVANLYAADGSSGDESAKPLQLRLLVVDDYPPGLMLLQQQFSFLGYRVVGAADGKAALAQWFAGDVDVVITDSRMPVMDGCALTEAIRQAERAESAQPCLIIGFTANAVAEERERCLAAGMDECFFKPMDLVDIDHYIKVHMQGVSPDVQSVPSGELDSQALRERLRRLPAADPKAMQLLVSTLYRTTQADIRKLEQLIMARDIEELANFAHRIRGAVGLIGAQDVVESCQALEGVCIEQLSFDGVRREAESLLYALRKLDAALQELQLGAG